MIDTRLVIVLNNPYSRVGEQCRLYRDLRLNAPVERGMTIRCRDDQGREWTFVVHRVERDVSTVAVKGHLAQTILYNDRFEVATTEEFDEFTERHYAMDWYALDPD